MLAAGLLSSPYSPRLLQNSPHFRPVTAYNNSNNNGGLQQRKQLTGHTISDILGHNKHQDEAAGQGKKAAEEKRDDVIEDLRIPPVVERARGEKREGVEVKEEEVIRMRGESEESDGETIQVDDVLNVDDEEQLWE